MPCLGKSLSPERRALKPKPRNPKPLDWGRQALGCGLQRKARLLLSKASVKGLNRVFQWPANRGNRVLGLLKGLSFVAGVQGASVPAGVVVPISSIVFVTGELSPKQKPLDLGFLEHCPHSQIPQASLVFFKRGLTDILPSKPRFGRQTIS